ncbi:MAG: type I-G CRISPR-associated RAMP protein Csb1/Cas7g [Acidimicrobiia bacterium]
MTVIPTTQRLLYEVGLDVVAGDRFQPTGFPDLGAAIFDRPLREDGSIRWEPALIVESAQSMANRLEAAAWDETRSEPVDTVGGLPYVRVVHAEDGAYLTSSRTEAHRLASAFVKDATLDGRPMREVIRERLDLRDDRPVSARQIAGAVFELDPFCLIHGVFFAEPAGVWPGQPKIARAVTAFIEAVDVQRAESGGVKRDHVRHSMTEGTGGTAEGYGTIPFHRTEWTAARLTLRLSLDRAQIRSYGLDDERTDLLEAIGLWQLRALLEGGLRLRTACDLFPTSDTVADQSGAGLAPIKELDQQIQSLVASIGPREPLEVRWSPKQAKTRAARRAEAETGEEASD